MRLSKILRLALNILRHSKLRSWLTIVGIVIGVAAVVAIVSIGEGLQQNIQGSLGGLGADLIFISPGGGKAEGGFRGGMAKAHGGGQQQTTSPEDLTKRDVQFLQSVDNVQFIYGMVSGMGEAYYLAETTRVSIDGVDPLSWKETTTSELASGRFLGPSDFSSVVVGDRIATETFKQELALNRMLTINDKSFKIVGILKESGGFGGDDGKIIMPIKAARETLESVGDEEFHSIIIKVEDVEAVDQVMGDVDSRLMTFRHLTERTKDFEIFSLKSIQEQIADVTQILTLFLGAIAAVSLLVGSVGIANTMFTSVLEKTKEIGIMKSIGAKNRDILLIFMSNAAMVGLVGGLLGIGLGAFISMALNQIAMTMMDSNGMNATAITPELLIGALLLSIAIGVLAGVVPAYRASKLKPVDALRYE